MQSVWESIVSKMIDRYWPQLEAAILRILQKRARDLIQQAKDASFPEKWKWLEPAFDDGAEEILKLLPAE